MPQVVDPLIRKGAMLGIVGDLFRPFSAILNAGLTANPDTPQTALAFRYDISDSRLSYPA